jgi:hypothetical protein
MDQVSTLLVEHPESAVMRCRGPGGKAPLTLPWVVATGIHTPVGSPLIICSAVAVVRFALGLIVVGAMLLWIMAAVHGFSGTYCFRTSGICDPSSDVTIQWETILWLGPVVFVLALVFLFMFRRPT